MALGKVIVVDDEKLITRPVSRLLKSFFRQEGLDYEVIASQSPLEILNMIENSHTAIALVISDIMMEPMNGLDFLRAVKSSHPETLIIALTGYTDQEIFRTLNEQLELYSYYEKPWDDKQFKRTIRNALNLYRRKRLLNKYVPEEIVEKVLQDSDDEILEGTELEATILFLDFRSSSQLYKSEKMGPKKALKHLNMYFEEMLPVLDKYNGILDKYVGDGFMALFGVPYPSNSPQMDAQNAVKAALGLREIVHAVNARSQEHPLDIGIGICTGQVIAGNIGTEQRANYTVLGTPANIATRLEKAARPIKDGILISPNTYAYTKDSFKLARRDDLAVIKEDESLTAYEVLGIL
jgi:class 3 adenylate cyclase